MRNSLNRNWLAALVLLFGLLGTTQPVRADTLDDFINLYAQIESQAPSGAMPVSAAYLSDSRDYIRCIANGTDVLICTDQYHDTGAGRDAANGAGIPSGFWMALDSYVAYKQGDYWSAAWSLGEAAACVALQILAGGADLCGLVEELYQLAKDIYGGASAVLDFLGDVGGAVWDGVSGAAEGLCQGVGLCDDDEDAPPLYVKLLRRIYSPRVKDGVDARESPDPAAYTALLDQLEDEAMAWARNLYSVLMYTMSPSEKEKQLQKMEPFFKSEIAVAEQGYNKAVDTAWTGDITGRVVPMQMQKRTTYLAQQLEPLAQQAAEQFVQNNHDPVWWVKNRCTEAFTKNDIFGMVDDWIYHFRPKANELNLKTNLEWCADTFWGGNQFKFGEVFRDYLRSQVCPGPGNTIRCSNLSAFQACSKLLGTVGQQDQCAVDVSKLGLEAAAKIRNHFKARKSQIPCEVIGPSGMAALVSNQPVKLQCTRPTQQAACDRAYQQYFGNLPVKVLDCTLQETAAYIALKGKVVAAVNTLNAALGEGSLMVGGNGDPLLVLAESGDTVWKVREYSRQDWGFGPPSSKPGFDYPAFGSKSIDGLSTPGVWHPVDAGKIILPHQDKFGRIKEQLDPSELIVNPMDQVNQVRGSERLQAKDKAQLQAKGNVQLQAQMEGGVQAPLQGQQQQPMSGSLPPGSRPPGKGASLSEKNNLQPAMTPPTPMAAKPDLMFTGVPRIGGQTVGWNGMVTLNAAQASGRRSDGSCEFLLDYSIRNTGAAAGGPFRITWGNPAASGGNRTVQLLAAGATHNTQDTVVLRPGTNRLNLVLDDRRRVDEGNEQNNRAALTITLSGTCGRTPSARNVPPTAPTAPTQPKRTPFQMKN
jgi:hypothetical protein